MSFANRSFAERFAVMGDVAESAFQQWAAQRSIKYVDYGLKRPPFDTFHDLPLYIRGQPDYICEGKGRRKFFVECKGTGGRVLKLKLETMEALAHWNNELTVWFFLYDSTNKRVAFLTYREMQSIADSCEVHRFPNDNKPYFHIPTSKFTFQDEGQENNHE